MKKFKFILKIFYGVLLGIALTVSIIFNVQSCNDRKTQTASADSKTPSTSGNGVSYQLTVSSTGVKHISLGQLYLDNYYLVTFDGTSTVVNANYTPTVSYSASNTSSQVDFNLIFTGSVNNSTQPYYSGVGSVLSWRYSFWFKSNQTAIAFFHFYAGSNNIYQFNIINITDLVSHFYNDGVTFGQNSVDTTPYYNDGYEDGYADGLETGTSSGYAQGFGEGLAQGLSSTIDYAQYFADGFNDGIISKYGTLQNADEYNAGYTQAQTDITNANTSNPNLVGRYKGLFDRYTEISYEATYEGFNAAFETWYQTGFNEAYETSNKLDNEDYIKARYDIYDLIDLGYTAGSNFELTIPDAAKRAFVAGYYEYIQTNSTYLTYFNNGYDTGYNTDLTTMYNNFKVQGGLGGKEVGYDLGQQDGLSYGNGSGGGIDVDVEAIYQNGFSTGYTTGYNAGYDDGYDVGYDEGYDDGTAAGGGGEGGDGYGAGYAAGLKDGTEIGISGIFAGATLSGTLTDTSGNVYPFNNIAADYINGGIKFNTLYAYLENVKDQDYWGSVDLTINFTDYVGTSDNISFYVTDSDVMGLTMYLQRNERIVKEFNYLDGDKGNYLWGTTITPLEMRGLSFNKIGLHFGRPVDTLQTSFNYFSNQLNNAYGYGYQEGSSDGFTAGFTAGKDEGIEIGKLDGYAQAVEEGTNASGMFFGAISIVRMLFTQAATLLALPIAGDITIGLIVIGMPAAFMLVDLVIKLVLGSLNRKAEATE